MIAQFISEGYPLNGKLFDWGAFVCTLMGILFRSITVPYIIIAAIYYSGLYDEAKKQDKIIKDIQNGKKGE